MPKSFMRQTIIIPSVLLFFLGALTLASCSKSDDQKEFENAALNVPNDYTEMTENGDIVNKDLDDWRVSPNYTGLVRVEIPAHPNPVVGNRFKINILISGIDAIPSGRMEFLIIDSMGEQYPISYTKENLTTGSQTILGRRLLDEIPLNETPDLFRILIFDGGNNIITYGDVKIE